MLYDFLCVIDGFIGVENRDGMANATMLVGRLVRCEVIPSLVEWFGAMRTG